MNGITMVGRLFILSVAAMWNMDTCAQTITWSEAGPEYLIQRWSIPPDLFTEEYAESRGLRIISEHAEKSFISVTMYVPTSEKCLLDQKGYHLNYRAWELLYKMCRTSHSRMVEVVHWRGGTVTRARRSDGTSSSTLLTGSTNPLELTMNGVLARVVHFAFPRTSAPVKDDRVEVFATIDEQALMSIETVNEMYRNLRRMLPLTRVSLYLRRDEWFIEHSHFPIEAPFGSTPRPSEAEFNRSWSAECSYLRERNSCVM
jgi:hypothetical protein